MKQSSTAFMDEMLKDNVQHEQSKDINEQIGEMIDNRLEQAMSKFTEELAKINNPARQGTTAQQNEAIENNEGKGDNEDEEGSQEENE